MTPLDLRFALRRLRRHMPCAEEDLREMHLPHACGCAMKFAGLG
jgi:hypothetical protein